MSDGHSMDGGQFENALARIPARKDIRRNPRSDTIAARNNRSIRQRPTTDRDRTRVQIGSTRIASHRIAAAISGSHNSIADRPSMVQRGVRPSVRPSVRRGGREEVSGSLE